MKGKRLLSLAAAFILALTLLPGPGSALTVKADSAAPVSIQLGSGVLQTNANTEFMQTLCYGGREWCVIAYDGKNGNGDALTYQNDAGQTENLFSSGTATLLQKDVVEYSSFNDNTSGKNANAYNGSDLQAYINSYIDGINREKIFTDSEVSAISERILPGENVNYDLIGYDLNKIKGSGTADKLWPLSVAEAEAVVSSFTNTSWWLRSPGDSDDKAAYVTEISEIIGKGCSVQAEPNTVGVRPAFDLNLNSVILTSVVEDENGKNKSVTVDADALVQVGTADSQTWKVTIGDSIHSDFQALSEEAVFEKQNQTLMVPYSGAVVGENEYISAIIMDSSGNVTYYGRMMKASSEPGAYVTINLKDKYNDGDTVYIFNEQANGGNWTDYASPLFPVSVQDAKEPGIPTISVNMSEWYEGGFNATQNAPVFTYDPDTGEGITKIDYVISDDAGNQVINVTLPRYYIIDGQAYVKVNSGSNEFQPYDFQELNEKADAFNSMHAGVYNGNFTTEVDGMHRHCSVQSDYEVHHAWTANPVTNDNTTVNIYCSWINCTKYPGEENGFKVSINATNVNYTGAVYNQTIVDVSGIPDEDKDEFTPIIFYVNLDDSDEVYINGIAPDRAGSYEAICNITGMFTQETGPVQIHDTFKIEPIKVKISKWSGDGDDSCVADGKKEHYVTAELEGIIDGDDVVPDYGDSTHTSVNAGKFTAKVIGLKDKTNGTGSGDSPGKASNYILVDENGKEINSDNPATFDWEVKDPPSQYQLVYDPGDNGSGEMDPKGVNDNEIFTFPECDFTAPDHKTFYYWEMSGVDGVFKPGDTVKISSNCADANSVITVTAHWKFTASATVEVVPIATVPTYHGIAQNLVTAGRAKDGTMNYALGKNEKDAPASGWSGSIPTATDAGTYYVWYKAAGDSTHGDSEAGCVTAGIKKRPVTLTSEGGEKIYDGSALTKPDVTVSGDGFVAGEVSDVKATGSVTEVAEEEVTNTITYTAESSFKEDNYTINKTEGKLKIMPKTVTVKAQDQEFAYNGTARSWDKYDVDGLVGNDKITAVVTGSITFPDEGPVTNKVESYQFTAGKAGNYSVTTQDGKLTMTNASAAITITAASQEWPYDGKAHSNNTVTLTAGTLFSGDELNAAAAGSVTNVADTKDGNNPVAEGYKVLHGDTDVTSNYIITPVAGTLTIRKVDSEVVTAPTSKEGLKYNGSAQELVKAGSVTGGTMQYALGTVTTAPENGWSDAIPTAIDAGTYYVWYKAAGDANHNDSDAGYVTAKILAPISAKVTFKVVNGSWDEGEGEAAKADRTVTLTGYEGDTLKLSADQIPAVGSKPDENYKAGSWDVTPDTETAITKATTYTYTYVKKDGFNVSVINGTTEDSPAIEGATVRIKAAAPGPDVLFLKWTTEDEGVYFDDPYEAETFFEMPGQDVTVTAVFAPPVTVSFDTKGGSPAVEDQVIPKGGFAKEPARKDRPVKAHYSCSGWYEESPEDSFDFYSPVEEDITLNAAWLGIVYVEMHDLSDPAGTEDPGTITINGDAGAMNPTAEFVLEDTDATLEAVANDGYRFIGWARQTGDPDDPYEIVMTDPVYTFKVGSNDEIFGFLDLGAVGDALNVHALFVKTAAIRFLNYDGTELQSSIMAYGETPVYTGAEPVKPDDEEYTYTFSGWTPEIVPVAGEAEYTAEFTAKKKPVEEYTVSFLNEDGTILQTGKMAYGETPVYTGETPVKKGTAQYSYTFIGWTPGITAVTGNATYTAVYDQKVNSYTIWFINDNGKVLQSSKLAYGEMPVYTGKTPTKKSDGTHTYLFKGWRPQIKAVTRNATYKAVYKAVSGTPVSKLTAEGSDSLVLSWNKVNGAGGYDIFFVKCGNGSKWQLADTIEGNHTFTWTIEGLAEHTAYKAYIKAWVMIDGEKTYVRTTPTVHACTSGYRGSYTNAKSVTVKQKSVALSVGDSCTIQAAVKNLYKNKKQLPHTSELRYKSTNTKVASVSSTGEITATASGTCKIYVYAVNGVRKAVTVTVQ